MTTTTTEIKTYDHVMVAAYIGTGSKRHLVSAVTEGKKYGMDRVTCGSNNSMYGSSKQHSLIELGEHYETTSEQSRWDRFLLADDHAAKVAEEFAALPNACAKCVKDARRAVRAAEHRAAGAAA